MGSHRRRMTLRDWMLAVACVAVWLAFQARRDRLVMGAGDHLDKAYLPENVVQKFSGREDILTPEGEIHRGLARKLSRDAVRYDWLMTTCAIIPFVALIVIVVRPIGEGSGR